MTFAEYRSYDALGLSQLVAQGQISPAELLELAIARTEQVEKQLNALTLTLFDRARATAQQLDNTTSSPFHGVPFLIKDLGLELEGTPTRIGSNSTAGQVSAQNSYLVDAFQRAGLVIFGKTNTPEFGLNPFTEPVYKGPTHNPWRLGYTPGGSSGGSAAAVSAGVLPMATASDGGGSIRMPAACCGLFGLKPSRGRLSLGPAAGDMWAGAVVEGCVSRTVRDTAVFLDTFAGAGPGELYSAPTPIVPYAKVMQQPPGKLRIGWSTAHPLGLTVDEECKRAVAHAAELLAELGHEVEEVPLPYGEEDLSEHFLYVILGEASAEVRRIGLRRGRPVQRHEIETPNYTLYLLGEQISGADFAYHRSCWNQVARRQGIFHQNYDLLLTPTLALSPFPIGQLQPTRSEQILMNTLNTLRAGALLKTQLQTLSEKIFAYMAYTPIANMTGQPAMSVPLHWTPEGLPVGVMLTSAIYGEDILLQLAGQLEEAQPWMERVPPL